MNEPTNQLQNEAEIQTDGEISTGSEKAKSSETPKNESTGNHMADSWQIVPVQPRVDSGNQNELIGQLKEILSQGHRFIAMNLKDNRFLSLPVIKFCVDAARELRPKGGSFILLTCPEKTKRHFEIYGSLDHIRILRSASDLRPLGGASASKPSERLSEPTL